MAVSTHRELLCLQHLHQRRLHIRQRNPTPDGIAAGCRGRQKGQQAASLLGSGCQVQALYQCSLHWGGGGGAGAWLQPARHSSPGDSSDACRSWRLTSCV